MLVSLHLSSLLTSHSQVLSYLRCCSALAYSVGFHVAFVLRSEDIALIVWSCWSLFACIAEDLLIAFALPRGSRSDFLCCIVPFSPLRVMSQSGLRDCCAAPQCHHPLSSLENLPCRAHVLYIFFPHAVWESSGNLVGIRGHPVGIRWASGLRFWASGILGLFPDVVFTTLAWFANRPK